MLDTRASDVTHADGLGECRGDRLELAKPIGRRLLALEQLSPVEGLRGLSRQALDDGEVGQGPARCGSEPMKTAPIGRPAAISGAATNDVSVRSKEG